jgi:hypothetical protein
MFFCLISCRVTTTVGSLSTLRVTSPRSTAASTWRSQSSSPNEKFIEYVMHAVVANNLRWPHCTIHSFLEEGSEPNTKMRGRNCLLLGLLKMYF